MVYSTLKKAKYLLYGIDYLVKTQLLGKEIPFIGGLVINERCNLACTHCKVSNRPLADLTYEDVQRGLNAFYSKGIRSLFIEGGEPFLWQSDGRDLNDVVALARDRGFMVISIYTNGTFPIKVAADTVFVSLDGLRDTNDALRGNSYDRAMNNIRESNHPNILINFTINRKNRMELEAFCQEIRDIRQIKGVFFYFHTPYYGYDELALNRDEKKDVINRIIALKKAGYRIFNSLACLKGVYHDTWERPSKICYVYANNTMYECCRANGNSDACRECGYLGYPEIYYILKLRPSAIWSALHYLPR